jgi:hypothetical protein
MFCIIEKAWIIYSIKENGHPSLKIEENVSWLFPEFVQ